MRAPTVNGEGNVALSADGSIEVSWRLAFSASNPPPFIAFRVEAGELSQIVCKQSTSAAMVRRFGQRSMVALFLKNEHAKDGTPHIVDFSYRCRAWMGGSDPATGLWTIDARHLPFDLVIGSDRGWLAKGPSRIDPDSPVRLSISWRPPLVVFGPQDSARSDCLLLSLASRALGSFEVRFGTFCKVNETNRFAIWSPCATPKSISDPSATLVASFAERAFDALEDLLGPPVMPLRDIVITPPREGGISYWTHAIEISVPHGTTALGAGEREARLFGDLAHELCHSWTSPLTAGRPVRHLWDFLEGLSVACADLVLYRLFTDDVIDKRIREMTVQRTYLLTRGFAKLLHHHSYAPAGIRTGCTLSLMAASPHSPFLGAIRAILGRLGDLGAMRSGDLSQVLSEHLGVGPTSVLVEVMDHPKPPVARARVYRSGAVGGRVEIRLPSSEAASWLVTALGKATLFPDSIEHAECRGRVAVLQTSSEAAARALVRRLTPALFVDRSLVQWTLIAAHPRLKYLSDAAYRLSREPVRHTGAARLKYLVLGVVEIIMRSAGPCGYELLARATHGWSGLVSRAFAAAAQSREVWP